MTALIALSGAQASGQANLAAPRTIGPIRAATATSPNGSIVVRVATDPDGRATYRIDRRGHPVIAPSALGFLFTDAPKIDGALAIESVAHETHDARWTQSWGEWRTIRDHHNGLRVRLRETSALHRIVDLVVRVQDDGVGFRYEFPRQPNLARANIAEELTEFAFAQAGTAWWKPAFESNREEYPYNRTALAAVGTAQTVMTVKLADGTHVALHEAALVDYAAMNVTRVRHTVLRALLTPGAGAPKVSRDLPFATPWRTLVIADDAPGLYRSHLELNLNEPNRLGDVGWIRPGKYIGVWWKMIRGDWTWSTGPNHGATTANAERYIDFAAANGIPGVLVEGWNVGWDGAGGDAMEFDRPAGDFDAAAIAAYAKARGVHLIGHNETAGSVSRYDDQLDRAFAYARDHGMPLVKTGYVAEAGQIDRVERDRAHRREWHEGQWMANHHLRVVTTAARYHIAIDTHEPIKDTGLRRTYPNWVTREGGRGMEYNAWAVKNPPEHETNLVFTQLLGGPMDYTPGIVSLTGSDDSAIPSTLARQLALYVVLYSPMAMAADTPENYARFPDAFRFIRDVPTDWEETRVLNGAVGDFATFVRKQRDGRDWFLGSITDETPRTLAVTLDFLDPGRGYTAEIYRDGTGADYRTAARFRFATETRRVRRGDALTLVLAPGGGQAIRFKADR